MNNSQTTQLNITDMDCAACVMHIEKALTKQKGITNVSVSFATNSATITHNGEQISPEAIVQTIKKAGYTATPMVAEHHNHEHHDHSAAEGSTMLQQRLYKLITAIFLSAIIFALMFFIDVPEEQTLILITALLILIYPGNEFFKRGIPGLLKGSPGMDTLVALGTGTAFIYSTYNILFTTSKTEYFMDVAIITTFILLGRYLENRAKNQASAAIKKLLELSAKVAHKIIGKNQTKNIAADTVVINDKLLVKPGEKIPVDGLIFEGTATVNESMVTGESIPSDKQTGDKVIGATINGNTSFKMRAEKVGKDTLLAHIIELVKVAQSTKAPIQKLVDSIAGYFVWGVIAIALITYTAWRFYSGEPDSALIATVAVLIIACPCALGLATPISIVVGSGKGASLGILLKNPESLEIMHKVTAICFDKTGTITQGKPAVEQFASLAGDKAENLSIALTLEEHSEHPIAKSIINFAKDQKIKNQDLSDFKAITGLGVTGIIAKTTYHLGSIKYLENLKIDLTAHQAKLDKLQQDGYTLIILANDKTPLAYFGIRDQIKDTSTAAIQTLKKMKIKPIMLTGDNQTVANAIAKEVGIDEVHAGISPTQKVALIKDLQKQGHIVAMVGDGINDSPALATANVGIAMGTGTDIAIESGDLILVKGDLAKAIEAIQLSEATLKNIKQNLFWAFIYNTIGIPIAALGLLNPAISALAMAFSSVSVVVNALRLKRFKPKSS
ncbi:copper-translocating P-type ATPase [Candidatus Peregrinibacteria bacterium CG11_big_fil_rev_8_21_14_0_20_41_10]|nr:MAG: copper-translocating P-type ATPase [Candidatus Peregrinibacteria bacterium CG11_big_fil_rev_8_21_14_0_20_41_10]PJC37591.1 MAG: copper-translocating P-type ATPase [Candidatus Peregrinibacteria bacterium CG_4_9_14_0_2_um_filter_41_14]